MIELKESIPAEIEKIVALESDDSVSRFIIPYSPDKHRDEMCKDSVIYLSVFEEERFIGFIILSLENDSKIEFRRIVIDSRGKGNGQKAIKLMEQYCKNQLHATSIWLDVFESNLRGQHIYKKLGFIKTGTGKVNGETILFYEKQLD